jgi:hypothetical protein
MAPPFGQSQLPLLYVRYFMCSIFPGEHSTIRSAIDITQLLSQRRSGTMRSRRSRPNTCSTTVIQLTTEFFLIALPIRKTNAKAGAILCCFTVIGLFARKPLKNPRFQVVPQQSTQTKL